MTMFFNRYGKIRCARLGLLVLGLDTRHVFPSSALNVGLYADLFDVLDAVAYLVSFDCP